MSAYDNKVRVFISSTFKDMHAERDHLVTVVFPELRERCERLGLEFFDVDLRWGVPEKGADGETANSWEYCRQWIDRVEPFFVCLLGQRYGWEPEPEDLKDEADRERQRKTRRSITDMEVRYGVLDTGLKRHSFFYLRDAEAPETATDFVDPPLLLAKLDDLKGEVRAYGRPVRDYPCEWRESGFTGMEDFGRMVLEDLWSGILRDSRYVRKEVWQQILGADPDSDARYTDESVPVPDDIAEKIIPLAKPPPKDPLDAEREQMAAFADSRLHWFQGREKELEELTSFILDAVEDDQSRFALVAAQPGQGKSALMAKLSREICKNAPDLLLITHFVGATPSSASLGGMLRRMCREVYERSNLEDQKQKKLAGLAVSPDATTKEREEYQKQRETVEKEFAIGHDIQDLATQFAQLLDKAAGDHHIVILLDALNQLDDGHDLGWLPYHLGPRVRIVVSCIEEPAAADSDSLTSAQKVLAALDSLHPKPKRVPLAGLDEFDVRAIVVGYLREYCKELDAKHVDAICALTQARNPLYLIVLLAELRTLGGNDMNRIVPELIASLSDRHPDTVSLFNWVLERLEVFRIETVRWWCLYLALGRAGMSGKELSDLLARKFGSDAAATSRLIERGLRRYLQWRGEQLDLFHGQLRQAVMERYGGEAIAVQGHREIADYFRALADPAGNETWKGENQRPFNETASHLMGAEEWGDLCAYLTDFRCLDHRIQAGQVYEVVKDHAAAIAVLPEFVEGVRIERERVKICRRYGLALVEYSRAHNERKDVDLPAAPASNPADAFDRVLEEHSSESKRLRIISNFVARQSTLLASHPVEFLPLAANAAAKGTLAEAEALINETKRTWFQRFPRPHADSSESQCLRSLLGHTIEGIPLVARTCVDVTPDGLTAVSGSNDQTVRVWDLTNGKCLKTLYGHPSEINGVRVTPDGRIAISEDYHTLRVWNLDTGQCIHILDGSNSLRDCLGITPDGRLAVSGGKGSCFRLWNLESGECLQTLQGHKNGVQSVSITPDGRRAVSAGGYMDNSLRIWDLTSGECLRTLQGHTKEVVSLSITPDGRRAVSAGGYMDNSLRVWDLTSGECVHIFESEKGNYTNACIAADGRRAVSAKGRTIWAWNLDSGKCISSLHSENFISSVCITADCRHAISGSVNGEVNVWDLSSQKEYQILDGHSHSVSSVCFTNDGRRIVSASRDETFCIWDALSGQRLRFLEGHTSDITCATISTDGHCVVASSNDNTLRVWDLESGNLAKVLQGVPSSMFSLKCVSVTPDGQFAIVGGQTAGLRSTLTVWDLESGACVRPLEGHEGYALSVCVTPDGLHAISGGDDGVRVFSLADGRCIQFLRGHTTYVTSVSVAQDGLHIVTGGKDAIRVWDLVTGQCSLILDGHLGAVHCVAMMPSGLRAVSGDDRSLRLWDLEIGLCLATYHIGTNVRCVAVSPLGDQVVCGAADGQLHFLTIRNFPPTESCKMFHSLAKKVRSWLSKVLNSKLVRG